jgi:DNA-binding CsgD family transcriptional regulator
MTERVSVLEPSKSGGVLALNLYRYTDQPTFSDRDFGLIELMAEPLFAVVKRHVELKRFNSTPTHSDFFSVGHFRDVLQAQCPDFSERELDVCARLLDGMSYEGIAADLSLSLSSVKTYRKRAFARLDINFKSELVRHYLLRGVPQK